MPLRFRHKPPGTNDTIPGETRPQPTLTKAHWTFLTNHAHVLLCLARDQSMRMRDIAEAVGITERTVQMIISDLKREGYLEPLREGRCNTYRIHREMKLRHPIEQHTSTGDLFELIFGASTPSSS